MLPKRVLDRPTNLSRKQARADLGPLRDNLVKLGTLKRYILAQLQFQLFIAANCWPLALSMEELDMQLRAFVEQAWEEGEQKALAADAISAAQHFLLTRRQFPGAWKLLGVWGKLELPSRAPPMPWEIAMALAGYALSIGRLDWAALVLTGHHCCLRTMEMLELTVDCVGLNQHYLGTITLMNTKIGQRHGQKEFVTIDSPFVGYWLHRACVGLPPNSKIRQSSSASFRTFFHQGLQAVGVASLNYKPYSLRRGGATADYVAHKDLARTMLRGRWADIRTAKIYIVEGEAMLLALKLPQRLDLGKWTQLLV